MGDHELGCWWGVRLGVLYYALYETLALVMCCHSCV